MTMKPITVAIDGPAGAGKSSVAKAVSQRMGIDYLDTEPCIGPWGCIC